MFQLTSGLVGYSGKSVGEGLRALFFIPLTGKTRTNHVVLEVSGSFWVFPYYFILIGSGIGRH